MARSVSVPYGAAVVAYDHVDTSDWDEFDAQWEWEYIEDDAVNRMAEISPSMSDDDGWLGREDKILASNGHAKFGMSEYCGLISYWLVPEDNDLARHWVEQVRAKFLEAFGTLRKIGQFSNGEGVYERVA